MTQGPIAPGERLGAAEPLSAGSRGSAFGVGVGGSAGWRSIEPGSSGSFESLFCAQFPVMFRLAHLLGADDPEDVAQEAFARLHRRWSELRDRPAVVGYVRTIVVNLVRSRQQHLMMARRRHEVPERTEVESAETTALDRVADDDILSSLGALSPRHREALVLRYWLDLSERQIADAMGISVGTAKSHLSRGLSALRAALADSGGV
jgi:RNA polymerase sigma-70 factor (sigma-E family)